MILGCGVDGVVSVLLLLVATSLDGFSAGIAYGLRGIEFSLRPRLLAAGVSVAALWLAVWIGRLIGGVLPQALARLLGGTLLIILGLWTAAKAFLEGERFADGPVMSWRIRSLGLVVQIVREPLRADFDSSGTIDDLEALWLGSALALDALGAGFLAALGGGMPAILPLLIGFANWVFLSMGLAAGRLLGGVKGRLLPVLPGLILVIIGIIQML